MKKMWWIPMVVLALIASPLVAGEKLSEELRTHTPFGLHDCHDCVPDLCSSVHRLAACPSAVQSHPRHSLRMPRGVPEGRGSAF